MTKASILEIESTLIEAYPGDTKGKSIVVTAKGTADKGETAQQYGQHGLISNPAKNTLGLRLTKGSLDIIIGGLNYNVPLPENMGETLLFSTDAEGVLKSQIYLKNDGTIKMDSGAEDLKTLFGEFIDEIKNIVTTGSPTTHTVNGVSQLALDNIKARFNNLWG